MGLEKFLSDRILLAGSGFVSGVTSVVSVLEFGGEESCTSHGRISIKIGSRGPQIPNSLNDQGLLSHNLKLNCYIEFGNILS